MEQFPFLYNRDPESHKGYYGHALLIAGSYGKMGAAILAARACLRSGVGLLTVHVPRSAVTIMQTAIPEAMLSVDDNETVFTTLPAHLDNFDAIAVGPGLGTDEQSRNVLEKLMYNRVGFLENADTPLVVDADGLNIMSLRPKLLNYASGCVLTPHAKEYERLFGDADPQAMADRYSTVIVKKSHRTHIYAPASVAMVNTTGTPAMATAGSGDVLTGVILSLLTQSRAYNRHHSDYTTPNLQAIAAHAVNMHGKAGERAAALRSQYSVIASDIVESL